MTTPNTRGSGAGGPFRLTVGLGLIVIGALIVPFWCTILPGWCWFCPRPCPPTSAGPPPTAVATITLEEDAAVWMPIDAAWSPSADPAPVTCAPPTSNLGPCAGRYSASSDRVGVVFQSGNADDVRRTLRHITIRYADPADPRTTLETVLCPVVDRASSPAHCDGYFDWLDANLRGFKCVMGPADAYTMLYPPFPPMPPTPIQSTTCDQYDSVLTPGGANVIADQHCLRRRAIHASMLPTNALVTYWTSSDAAMYSMSLTDTPKTNHEHRVYTFELHDPIDVDHWLEGCHVKRFERVREMIFTPTDPEDQHHGDFSLPPMNGRRP